MKSCSCSTCSTIAIVSYNNNVFVFICPFSLCDIYEFLFLFIQTHSHKLWCETEISICVGKPRKSSIFFQLQIVCKCNMLYIGIIAKTNHNSYCVVTLLRQTIFAISWHQWLDSIGCDFSKML